MNRLSRERAAYLRNSAAQNIDWYPWCEEAFEKAAGEDKPVFLSSGAVWCHWCHVMAKECFYNEAIVDFLNKHFICIKLDRDERPDIDRRYQRAIAAMGLSGGWPLSVFLMPDKRPFFGGTYFPPDDSYGRPGFKKILNAVADLYQSKRDDVLHYAGELMEALKPEKAEKNGISESMVVEAEKDIAAAFDLKHGGFGAAPKFPMPGALSFMLNRYFLTRNEFIGHAVKKTLEAMAGGGLHDQLKGGFHRYSVDEAWIAPHFEKMADDNAWLLKNYTDAYRVFGDEYFKEVASGIIGFTRDVLSDADGGFYASQDADITPDDEGGHFTWTDEDFRAVLDEEEYRVLSMHLLHKSGEMRHDSAKRVLFIAETRESVAAATGMDLDKVSELIRRGKRKLLHARDRREAPFVDSSLYTSLNGMLISAYLRAAEALGNREAGVFALASLERVMKSNVVHGELVHSGGVRAFPEDYIYLADALTEAYEATGDRSFLDRADALMEACIERFWDKGGGGFFDSDAEVIGLRLKGIEDVPHPSANSSGVLLLLRLSYATGKEIYRSYAGKALEAFSSDARQLGVHAGYYYCALDAYYNMTRLNLETKPGSPLANAALSRFSPYKTVTYGEDRGRVVPCIREVCYEPIQSPDDLKAFMESKGRKV